MSPSVFWNVSACGPPERVRIVGYEALRNFKRNVMRSVRITRQNIEHFLAVLHPPP